MLIVESGFKLLYFIKKYEEEQQSQLNSQIQEEEETEFNSFKFILTGMLSVGSTLGTWGKRKLSLIFNYCKIARKMQPKNVNIHEFNVEDKKDTNE